MHKISQTNIFHSVCSMKAIVEITRRTTIWKSRANEARNKIKLIVALFPINLICMHMRYAKLWSAFVLFHFTSIRIVYFKYIRIRCRIGSFLSWIKIETCISCRTAFKDEKKISWLKKHKAIYADTRALDYGVRMHITFANRIANCSWNIVSSLL